MSTEASGLQHFDRDVVKLKPAVDNTKSKARRLVAKETRTQAGMTEENEVCEKGQAKDDRYDCDYR